MAKEFRSTTSLVGSAITNTLAESSTGPGFFPPDSHYCSVSLGLSLLPFLLYGTCPGQLQSCLTKLSIRKHFPKPFLSSPSENMSPIPHQLGHTSHLFMKIEEVYFAFGDVSVLR